MKTARMKRAGKKVEIVSLSLQFPSSDEEELSSVDLPAEDIEICEGGFVLVKFLSKKSMKYDGEVTDFPSAVEVETKTLSCTPGKSTFAPMTKKTLSSNYYHPPLLEVLERNNTLLCRHRSIIVAQNSLGRYKPSKLKYLSVFNFVVK